MQNPAFQQSMMQLQMKADEGGSGKSVTKEQAKEMFIYVEESKQEMMKSYKDLDMMGDGGQEMTLQLLIDHAKVVDMLHEKYGVEEEDFTRAIQEHNLMNDPDIMEIMRGSLAKMNPEMMGAIGAAPMGGAMPMGGAPAPGGPLF